jgi:hypothetical protein
MLQFPLSRQLMVLQAAPRGVRIEGREFGLKAGSVKMASVNPERRQRERLALRCPVRILASAESPADDAVTVNLSSQGIYWISQIPCTPGQRIGCYVFINPNGFRSGASAVSLYCRVRVVRVEEVATGFGVGGRIEQYAFSRVCDDGAHTDFPAALQAQRAGLV